MAEPLDNYVNVVDTSDDASMDEIYVTYVDDEHVDNHDYDDTTDDDHDNNNDIYVSGPDPGRTQAGPVRTRPDHCYYHDHHQ